MSQTPSGYDLALMWFHVMFSASDIVNIIVYIFYEQFYVALDRKSVQISDTENQAAGKHGVSIMPIDTCVHCVSKCIMYAHMLVSSMCAWYKHVYLLGMDTCMYAFMYAFMHALKPFRRGFSKLSKCSLQQNHGSTVHVTVRRWVSQGRSNQLIPMDLGHFPSGHFPPDIFPRTFMCEIDDKSRLNRGWTDKRSLY